MYKILGADRKEYGPVSADQVREWIAQGRANGQTKVQAVGSAEWQPLAALAEFTEALSHSARPPVAPPLAGVPGLPGAAAAHPKTSGLAISSLVLGILGLFTCGITALFGLVLGIIAMVKIEKSKGQVGGKGVALAGLIVSGLLLVVMPVVAALLVPALGRAKQKAMSVQCMMNVRMLNLGLVMYADAHNGQLPGGGVWCDSIQQYVGGNPKVFVCSEGKPGLRSHYAFNSHLAGVSQKDITSPATTVLVFETDGGWNVSGGKELLLSQPRHDRKYVVGFADGHAEMVKPAEMGRFRWEP